ncbi:MAG: hypothetical protein CME61_00440 [Halobacteriovoraceae bacterium]|nr:hypothetical protein [Halobacteriovoraceae bacterium]|tara:strand:+ start:182 stop:580 length:399 start_codon:yes stop_codon:yes gene_type:complete
MQEHKKITVIKWTPDVNGPYINYTYCDGHDTPIAEEIIKEVSKTCFEAIVFSDGLKPTKEEVLNNLDEYIYDYVGFKGHREAIEVELTPDICERIYRECFEEVFGCSPYLTQLSEDDAILIDELNEDMESDC